ncbi:MAG: MBL fold metallo-hydrolase [Acidobacteria bacterium]|nr:MAG: MBL fold metallo-hydrolase [Acidobacteriota bacterium]RLE22570.1 MAG: MBL fold metallo-hydrolase [Acidobacteriota bacterium]
MIACSVLASGSRGNSTYIRFQNHSFLIDCGLSCKALEARLAAVNVDPMSIEGIFLTHEHIDHIKSVHTFSRRFSAPIYATEATWLAAGLGEKKHEGLVPIVSGKLFSPAPGLEIFPCPVSHDAVDPVGFIFQYDGVRISQVTDLGYVTELVACEVKGSRLLLVESNHDPQMLKMSQYPWELKQRIMGRRGHLSNQAAAELVERAVTELTEQVILTHLSEENNMPDIALMTTLQKLGDLKPSVSVASQREPTPLLTFGVTVRG